MIVLDIMNACSSNRFSVFLALLMLVNTLSFQAEDMSKKWRLDKNENDKEKYMSKELSKVFGQKASR